MKKPGFLGKQLLLYSISILLVMVVTFFWAHSYVMDISREKAVITQEQLTNSTLSQVDGFLDHLMLITTQVAHDTNVIQAMETLHENADSQAGNRFAADPEMQCHLSDILDMHNQIKNPVYRIEIYNTDGDYLCTDATPELLQAGSAFCAGEWSTNFMQQAFVRDQRDFIMMGPYLNLDYPDPEMKNCVYIIMPIRNHDETVIYGYAAVYQTFADFETQLKMDQETGIDVYLFSYRDGTRGRQIFPRDREFPDTSDGSYYETELQSHYDWYVVLLQNQDAFLASYRSMLVYLYLGGIALFILLFVCVFFIVRHTSRPILELSERVKETSLTNLPDLPVSDDTLDEVKELQRSVDHMIQRIKASVELEQRAYLKALQAQMNPHFLYNCLSTISSLGTEAESPSIPRFCTHLASILRYETTYKNDLVTLEDELNNVRDYLELMKIRYEDDISYDVEAEEALLTLPLPRLVLQPLVENCFSHGFKAVEPPWQLSVRAFREGRNWVIQVRDNGIGFPEDKHMQLIEQVEQLTRHLGEGYSDLEIGGLGLANTIVRLRLMSVGEPTFSIEPNTPTGTILTLRGELHD